MAAQATGIVAVVLAVVLAAILIRLARWLDGRAEEKRRLEALPGREERLAAAATDRNPGGPITEGQARRLLEDILQAAIRQKAGEIIIDRLSGRPQVRLRLDGRYQELTGIGDGESFQRLVAAARSCAGLPAAPPGGRGAFHRLYRKGHLRDAGLRVENGEIFYAFNEVSRRNRAVRFDLESCAAPGGEALRISLGPEVPAEDTRFNLGFAAEAEAKYVRAVRSRSGIVLLTGPCHSGKSTATYHALSLLRDEGRKIVTVEWPIEWMLKGTIQYRVREGGGCGDFERRLRQCLRRAIERKPDVLMLQNIDWVSDEDARVAIDFAAGGGLLVTAVHVRGSALGLASLLRCHFVEQRQDAADLVRAVVSPRRLSMVCMHCAEEVRVPAGILREAGLSDAAAAVDGWVATWKGRGCPLCEHSGTLGSIAVYEVLDLAGEMKRFLENANEWNFDQVEYLERQAWQHGMRTQRELALERVLAGDISLQEALLNTVKPGWLVKAQAAGKKANGAIG